MKQTTATVERHYTLREAVERFFPNGPLTVASLRSEIKKGRLRATMPAGKLLVTETAIAGMLEQCRVLANNLISHGNEHRPALSSGSSETERSARAQAAAWAVMTRKRNGNSQTT
jgi:hypothetical protein